MAGGRPAAVRPAEHRDESEVAELAAGMATTFVVDREVFRDTFARLVDDDGAFVLVADVDGRVGGYLLGFVHPAFYAGGPVAWIEELAVVEDLRRNGLGRLLVREFEERCGAGVVALATRRAGDFYASLGYEPSATYYRKLSP